MKNRFTLLFCFVASSLAFSQDAAKSPLTFSGYLDTYYQANTNNPKSGSNMGATNARVFDQKNGVFQVGLAQIKTSYGSEKVDGVVDLVFGNFADLTNYGNIASPLSGSTSTALAIKQAYLTWKPTGKLSLTAGQFGTHIGYEVTDAPVNFQYSLSNLFNNGPFYHTGVKAQVALSSKAYLMAGVVNGVDTKDDINKGKSLIGQLWVNPASGFNVYLNVITGDEGVTEKSAYTLGDLTTSYQVSDKFLMGLNAAVGSQAGNSWYGVALYPSVVLSDKASLGARYEYFNNDNAARGLLTKDGAGTHVNSFTLTASLNATPNLMFKPEIRADLYPDSKQFEDKNGSFTKSSQTTIGIAAILKF